MARSEARLQFGMWRAGLDGLGPLAKLVYCVLLTEPTLNHCGVGAVRMSRWAKDASLTIADTEKALQELIHGTFIVVDDDTEEVFVRTLIRNDGVAAQPYVLKGALREAVLTASPVIRQALAGELRKLPPKAPDGTSKAGKRVVYPDPHATADELWPVSRPTPPKPTRKGPETLFDANPSETLSEGSSSNPSETLHGGGGGGGISSCVAISVERTTASQDRDASAEPAAETPNKVAQRLARAHYERHPLVPFVAVMKLSKRALDGGYSEPAVAAALLKLSVEGRPVTADSLRIALDGPPLRSTSSPQPVDRLHGWQALKTGTDDRALIALPGGESA